MAAVAASLECGRNLPVWRATVWKPGGSKGKPTLATWLGTRDRENLQTKLFLIGKLVRRKSGKGPELLCLMRGRESILYK